MAWETIRSSDCSFGSVTGCRAGPAVSLDLIKSKPQRESKRGSFSLPDPADTMAKKAMISSGSVRYHPHVRKFHIEEAIIDLLPLQHFYRNIGRDGYFSDRVRYRRSDLQIAE